MAEYKYGETILKVENVSLEIEGKLILRDINLEIKDIIRPNNTTGQIIGLIGPSGRGKTQLFKILSGLKKPTTGTVLVNGNSPVKAGDVGVVAQNYPLFEHRTIQQNLFMVLSTTIPSKERQQKVDYYLEKFKMIDHRDKYPAVLSGGQRQRIAIIQQLLCSDYFILLDEPFSGLDPIMTENACEIIQEMANLSEKNTIIIVSHDIYSTVAIANELWMLGFDYNEDGSVIPGARIKYLENLMDKDLCWKNNLQDSAEYFNFVKDVRKGFKNL